MKILVYLLTTLGIFLWAATGFPWEIRTQGPVTITGEGPLPTIVTAPLPPPVVVPPPVVPPVVPPPGPPPITDNSPFPFPTQQPEQETDGACRYFDLCPGDGCYATLPNCGNPLKLSHRLACLLPNGLRLFVPAGLAPARIRALCSI